MNKKYILILILGILFTSCEKDEIILPNSSQEFESQTNLNSLEFFKKWHQNQNKSSENSFYNFTKRIEWKNAESFSSDSLDIAIIPLLFDKNFSLQKSDKILENLSLVMINNEGQYTSSYILASDKKIQLNKENVLNEIFDTENIYIIQHSKVSNYKNSLNSSKNKNLYKYVSKTCYEIVEVFTDGSIRHTGITYCETSDSGSSGDGGPHSGGGGSTTSGGSSSGAPTPAEIFEYKIDDSKLAACFKKVLDSLKTMDVGIGQLVAKFSENDAEYSWNVEDGSLTYANASTKSIYDRTNNEVTTVFDSSKYKNASDLSIARTMSHEVVHAYIVAELAVNPMGANDKFADYFKEWNKKTYPTRSETEHAEFVRNYVGDIALSLKEYGDKMGYNENDQFYKDLAWGGLTHWKKRDSTGNPVLDSNGNYVFELTTWFKNSFSSTEQSRILDVISIEQSGKDMNQKTKPKKGQNANC